MALADRPLLPQSPVQRMALAVALLFLAGAVGFFVGGRDTEPSADSVDVGFLQDMISHHEQAIQMAMTEIVRGTEPTIEVFAREIVLFQSYEIGLMEQQLREWGRAREDRSARAMAWMDMSLPVDDMPGMASDDELERLRAATGRDVDALFVRLMQDHHRGGAHMATFAAEHASREFVRALADRMARNQLVEVGELERAGQRAALPADPTGYTVAEIPDDHPS